MIIPNQGKCLVHLHPSSLQSPGSEKADQNYHHRNLVCLGRGGVLPTVFVPLFWKLSLEPVESEPELAMSVVGLVEKTAELEERKVALGPYLVSPAASMSALIVVLESSLAQKRLGPRVTASLSVLEPEQMASASAFSPVP